MPMEHLNERGELCQGYYCGKCGGATGMYGHSKWETCVAQPEKVKKMNNMNKAGSPEAYMINKLKGMYDEIR